MRVFVCQGLSKFSSIALLARAVEVRFVHGGRAVCVVMVSAVDLAHLSRILSYKMCENTLRVFACQGLSKFPPYSS